MSRCFSFVVLFATFFAVTAEEFDPRDYMQDKCIIMEYRRILPDKPMLANYAALFMKSNSLLMLDINSSNLAPFITDMTVYGKINARRDQFKSNYDTYVLNYSKDAFAEKHYKYEKDNMMRVLSLNPQEITDKDNVRLLKNDRRTLAYISENFIYESKSDEPPELEKGKLVAKQKNTDGSLISEIPLTDFAKKNQKSKEAFSLFDFDSNTIYFSIQAPNIYCDDRIFLNILPSTTQTGGIFSIQKYIQYLATSVSYDSKTDKCRMIFSILCRTPERAKEFYDSFFKGKGSYSNIFLVFHKSFELEFTPEISGRKVSVITEIGTHKFLNYAKDDYEKKQCSSRIAALSQTLEKYAKANDSKFPISLQQLELKDFIINPEELTCPATRSTYVYFGSGETLESIKDMPIIMDRNPNGTHFYIVAYNWSQVDFLSRDNMTWDKRLNGLSQGRNSALQFVRKKMLDYEKINIDAE